MVQRVRRDVQDTAAIQEETPALQSGSEEGEIEEV